MRISDWSSDVCSSDLEAVEQHADGNLHDQQRQEEGAIGQAEGGRRETEVPDQLGGDDAVRHPEELAEHGERGQHREQPDPCLAEARHCRGFDVLPCRSEEHTSELQSLMRISYAVFCLKKKQYKQRNTI